MPKEFKRNGFVTRETGCFHEHIILLERPFLDDVYCPFGSPIMGCTKHG